MLSTKSTKKFLREHRTAVLITGFAVSTAVAYLMYRGLKQHDEFLLDKGLYEEYYFVPEDE